MNSGTCRELNETQKLARNRWGTQCASRQTHIHEHTAQTQKKHTGEAHTSSKEHEKKLKMKRSGRRRMEVYSAGDRQEMKTAPSPEKEKDDDGFSLR